MFFPGFFGVLAFAQLGDAVFCLFSFLRGGRRPELAARGMRTWARLHVPAEASKQKPSPGPGLIIHTHSLTLAHTPKTPYLVWSSHFGGRFIGVGVNKPGALHWYDGANRSKMEHGDYR